MATPEVVSLGSSRHTSRTILLVCGILFTANAFSAARRLVLDRSSASAPGEIKGLTEITVVPPFEDARVALSIDGQIVSKSLRSPYKINVDFGPIAIDHVIAVSATSANGKRRVEWNRRVNRGKHSLGVTLRELDAGAGLYEADVTFSEGDPVTRVEFYDQQGLIATLQHPPYQFQVPQRSLDGLVRVTATTRSGSEVTDFFTRNGDIHVESYDLRTVKLFVSVVDQNGTVRGDVPAGKFQVIDNGTLTRILAVDKAMKDPISVAVVLDASASMVPWMERASKAALRFLERVLRPEDACAVFAINSVPRRHLALTHDQAAARKALESVRPSGSTALFDSLDSAIRELQNQGERRAIVVLSDGDDTASIATFEETLQRATTAGIPIYVIAFAEEETPGADLNKLGYLASQTGGFLTLATSASLDDRYDEISRELREQYSIRYEVSDLSRPNQWRQVRVVVKSPTLHARTISGYFAQ